MFLAFMKHYVQSINISLTTVESVDTRDFNAQVGTTVELVVSVVGLIL